MKKKKKNKNQKYCSNGSIESLRTEQASPIDVDLEVVSEKKQKNEDESKNPVEIHEDNRNQIEKHFSEIKGVILKDKTFFKMFIVITFISILILIPITLIGENLYFYTRKFDQIALNIATPYTIMNLLIVFLIAVFKILLFVVLVLWIFISLFVISYQCLQFIKILPRFTLLLPEVVLSFGRKTIDFLFNRTPRTEACELSPYMNEPSEETPPSTALTRITGQKKHTHEIHAKNDS